MKLQPASKKELARISVGTLLGDVVMLVGLYVLSLVDIGTFSLGKILLSLAIGSAIAIGNFAVMCLTAQSAVGMTDMKKMKAKFQLSYNARMVVQAGWAVLAYLFGCFHFVAAAAPILFPKLTILYLNATGRLMPKTEVSAEAAEETEPEA